MSRVVFTALLLVCFLLFSATGCLQSSRTKTKSLQGAIEATINIYCNRDVEGDAIVGWGSGVIIGKGQVLTAAHVVESCYDGITYYDNPKTGDTVTLIPLDVDTIVDVAILYPFPLQDLGIEPIKVAAKNPEQGDHIYAIGYPAPYRQKLVTGGVVSGYLSGSLLSDVYGFFGNSGGPVVDEQGRLIGIMVGLNLNPFGISNTVIVTIEAIELFLLRGRLE